MQYVLAEWCQPSQFGQDRGFLGHRTFIARTEQSPWQTWMVDYPIRANSLSLDVNLDIHRLIRTMRLTSEDLSMLLSHYM